MEYVDDAILLTVAKAGKGTLVLEVLTANHGRQRCVSALKGGDQPTLLPGSFLSIKCVGDDLGKPVQAELLQITGGLIINSEQDIALAALTSSKDLLVSLVPIQEPVPAIFEAMTGLMTSLVNEDHRWPYHYAMLEFALLAEAGYLEGVRRCMSAFRHGDAIYVSPRTGAFVTREEGGVFIDKLIPLPGFLLGGKNTNLPAVRQGFALTATLLQRFALKGEDQALPQTRAILEAALEQVTSLPAEPTVATPMEDAETRRRRMEAMRPLMVASASSGQ